MSPQDSRLTLDESLRAACQMGRVEAELLAPAIETLAKELTRLEPNGAWPETVRTAVAAGENAGIADALTALDWLYVNFRRASDKAHAAELAKVLP